MPQRQRRRPGRHHERPPTGLGATLREVTLRYGRTVALDRLDLTLSPGKIYGLIGRNGSGKTSLLSLLAAFRRPTSGQVRIAGEDPF
jgi:ABC-2 type transport system ATP-binding protein